LANRLQARLDEEEFGMIDMGIAAPEPTSAPSNTTNVPTVQGGKKEITNTTAASSSAPSPPTQDSTAATADAKITNTTTVTGDPKKDSNPEAKTSTNTATTSTPSTNPTSKSMTFADKKRARAARFGIPVVGSGTKSTPNNDNKRSTYNNTNNESSTESNGGGFRNTSKSEEINLKKKRKTTSENCSEVLSEDEILRRIRRAQKFGLTDNLDKLKAQLRKHRFAS